jgi:hypothetical protein
MKNFNNILNSLDLMIEKENQKKSDSETFYSSYYSALKQVFIESKDNDFARNIIINAFYSVLKEEQFKISEFINDDSFLAVLSDYKSFKQNFETNYNHLMGNIISKFETLCNFKEVKNQSEITSYVITESLVEYSKSKIKFIPRSFDKEINLVGVLHEKFLKAENDTILIQKMNDLPYGFYISSTLYKKIISTSCSTPDYCLISNQEDGITIYETASEVIGRVGLDRSSYTLKNFITKEHEEKLIFNNKDSNQQSIAIFKSEEYSDFEKLDLINKLIIQSFISLALSKEEQIKIKKENKSLLFNKSSITGKINLPVVSNLEHEEMKDFTFNDLRFTGKYDFMSLLDDIFENVFDMDLVNTRTKNESSFFYITEKGGENKKDFKFNKEMLKEKITLSEKEYKDFSVSMTRDRTFLTPLPESFVGTKKEVREHTKKIALMNKLTLTAMYMEYYELVYSEIFRNELKNCLDKNIDSIINDEDILSLIKVFGHCKNRSTNYYNISPFKKTLFISHDGRNLDELDKDESIKEYSGKRKATWLASICFFDYRIIEVLIKKYGLKLSKESMNVLQFQKIRITLDEMYKAISIKNKIRTNFFNFYENGIDIELNKWFYDDILAYVLIPMNEKQINDFKSVVSSVGGKLQDCDNRNGNRINILPR